MGRERLREIGHARTVATPQTVQMFDDDAGWIALPGLLAPDDARSLSDACVIALASIGDDIRAGDKQAHGTLHLVDVVERVPADSVPLTMVWRRTVGSVQ
jgi:hypothetical protein